MDGVPTDYFQLVYNHLVGVVNAGRTEVLKPVDSSNVAADYSVKG